MLMNDASFLHVKKINENLEYQLVWNVLHQDSRKKHLFLRIFCYGQDKKKIITLL